jgi:hypothetical protein
VSGGRPRKGTLELRSGRWHARLTVTLDGERARAASSASGAAAALACSATSRASLRRATGLESVPRSNQRRTKAAETLRYVDLGQGGALETRGGYRHAPGPRRDSRRRSGGTPGRARRASSPCPREAPWVARHDEDPNPRPARRPHLVEPGLLEGAAQRALLLAEPRPLSPLVVPYCVVVLGGVHAGDAPSKVYRVCTVFPP